jgi:hypothetical protein
LELSATVIGNAVLDHRIFVSLWTRRSAGRFASLRLLARRTAPPREQLGNVG